MDEHTLRWRMHAKTPRMRRVIGYADAAIEQAVSAARFAVSWSGGKDSTAMVALVRSVDSTVPIMVQFDDCDWPTKRPYIERVAAAHGWDFHAVEPAFSVWDRMAQRRIGEDAFCSLTDSLTKDSFLRPLAAKQDELGCDGVFMGLRADESKARGVHLRTRKELYRLKSGAWRCCPLARWSSTDVFAYLVSRGIEINPCYMMNRFHPPEEIRLSWAVPTPTSLSHGDMAHFRHYYPAQFRKMRDLGVC